MDERFAPSFFTLDVGLMCAIEVSALVAMAQLCDPTVAAQLDDLTGVGTFYVRIAPLVNC